MRHFRKTVLSGIAIATAAAGIAVAAYPEKTINYIIAFGPGGESDVSARLQEPFFKKLTGQTVAIQYKAGAGGAAAWSQINKAPGDGYTIIGTNLPHIILQPLQKDVGYKTAELANVYWFHFTPDAIMVHADSPYKTLEDMIAAAKKAPGTVTFTGSGTNSSNHLAQQRFDKLAGMKTTYIPSKGTGESNTALLGKHVSAAWSYTTVGLQLGNQVRCLAVAMDKRHPALPDCPTFKERGFQLTGGAYRGIAVPNTTPKATQQAVSDLIGKINKDPAFVKSMEDKGFAMVDVGVDGMAAFMAERQKEYEAIAREMGIIK
ncbi:MAG TPA: tripartite tricarboxylate transporter substrate binding protein [Usitatibacteraceae bacterium]|jgi:tripartite-type tricarboxylate transporter receptor subunit TctC|nr:tripartite tricarboxylate transporter substrate binding protein [Usitatibacteraceae bacterium]HRA23484.1 tripartite tricarboxylate transporter substrate binding protein [Usitatibacteraceae bacterium]